MKKEKEEKWRKIHLKNKNKQRIIIKLRKKKTKENPQKQRPQRIKQLQILLCNYYRRIRRG